MQTAKEIGLKIKKMREEKKFSRNEFANKIGVSTSAIVNYENGDRVPRDEIKVKIAKELDNSVSFIFFE